MTNNSYLLIATDGYSIDTEKYKTKEAAIESMKKAYNILHPDEKNEEWEDMNWVSDDDAILYANGESVYVWSIIEI